MSRGSPGLLTGINAGAGDRHRQGRSVIIASFTSGAKVVYKPRSLAVDVHFQELLHWVDERGHHPPFRRARIIDRGTHGWVEFVGAEGCSIARKVRRFYRRQGGYLALLHVLRGTDFHHENLVAAGEHPVLVDVEALYHPELFAMEPAAEGTLRASVLAVGLLPCSRRAGRSTEGIDVSGLGAVEGALWPGELPRWERAGTDDMRMARARVSAELGLTIAHCSTARPLISPIRRRGRGRLRVDLRAMPTHAVPSCSRAADRCRGSPGRGPRDHPRRLDLRDAAARQPAPGRPALGRRP